MIHPAGWEEASLDGKTLFAGFAGTHDVGCSFRTVSTRGGVVVRCQQEFVTSSTCGGLMQQATASHENSAAINAMPWPSMRTRYGRLLRKNPTGRSPNCGRKSPGTGSTRGGC